MYSHVDHKIILVRNISSNPKWVRRNKKVPIFHIIADFEGHADVSKNANNGTSFVYF